MNLGAKGRLFFNQRGSVKIWLAITVVAGAAIWAVFRFTGEDRSPASRNLGPEQVVENLRSQVLAAADSTAVVNFTVARNGAQFGCLYTADSQCRGQGGLFQLFEGTSPASPVLTQVVQGRGFTHDLRPCSDFPSLGCPLRAESRWEPICGNSSCDGVRNVKFLLTVTWFDGAAASHQTRDEKIVTPRIELSASAQCAREGGVFDGAGCVKGGRERNVASVERREGSAAGAEARSDRITMGSEADDGRGVDPRDFPYRCPEAVVVQGQDVAVEWLAPGKAKVRTPALNNCPAWDEFLFSCVPMSPPTPDNLGQWVQTGSSMAPPCDEYGNPLSGGATPPQRQ